jgi:hypothetical protein
MTEQDAPSDSPSADDADDDEHLSDVAVGAGCTEIWEHLSEQRLADD